MQLLKQEAIYGEAKIGDTVELLEAYMLIRKGSCGEIVSFEENGTIKVEFPLIEVGKMTHVPMDENDRFIYAKPSELKLV